MADAPPAHRPRTPGYYRLVKATISGVLRLCGGFTVRGIANIPAAGGALICPNHISFMDPPAVGAAVPGHTYFMAKQELFSVPVLGWLIGRLYTFPVDRGGADRGAVRTAIEALQAGNLVTIFAEGGRSPDGSLQRANTGPALIANRAGVPVVPACVKATDQVLPRGSVYLHRGSVQVDFGEPVWPEEFGVGRLDKAQLRAMTERVMQEIEALQQTQYERVGQRAPARTKEYGDADSVPPLRC
jgi:1-acyl-sn-glycerol-3-phosphate acyltransferase